MSETQITFFRLSNLSSFITTPCAPWADELPEKPSEDILENKRKYNAWLSDEKSEAYLYSAVEGLNPRERIGKENPPAFLHGVVLDFDSPWDPTQIAKWKTPEFPCPCPNYVHNSRSGNLRAIYVFNKPIPVVDAKMAQLFFKEFVKHLRLKKLAAGLDEGALKAGQYLDRGFSDILDLNPEPVRDSLLQTIMFKASRNYKDWTSRTDPEIPADVIYKEVEARFPNRWVGSFVLGERGVRFWDPSADNPTAAVIRESGMQCFTGESAFLSWREIFGNDFVKQFEESSLGEIGMNCAYDGKNFWHQSGGFWRMESLEAFKRLLRGRYRRSSTTPKEFSQLDEALLYIQENRRMDHVGPFVHFPPGPINLDGFGNVLNTSSVTCMEPHREPCPTWGEGFPRLSAYLDSFFENPGEEQLEHFLAWFKWFYQNALTQTPQPGQALVLAGPVGAGKTFLTTGLVGRAVGGYTDATEYLMGKTEFSSDVGAKPIMAVDDSTPGTDFKGHSVYTAMLKKVIANHHLRYRKMRTDPVQVLWLGRATISCNLDPQSMDLLPGLEQSNREKVSLFLCKNPDVSLPSIRQDAVDMLDEELPFLLRWLLDWEPGPELLNGTRFGTKEYHHPKLVAASAERSSSQIFVELVEAFLHSFKGQHDVSALLTNPNAIPVWDPSVRQRCPLVRHPILGPCWYGTTAKLAEAMRDAPECGWVREFSMRQISLHLSKMQSQGMNIRKDRQYSSQIWFVPVVEGIINTEQ